MSEYSLKWQWRGNSKKKHFVNLVTALILTTKKSVCGKSIEGVLNAEVHALYLAICHNK